MAPLAAQAALPAKTMYARFAARGFSSVGGRQLDSQSPSAPAEDTLLAAGLEFQQRRALVTSTISQQHAIGCVGRCKAISHNCRGPYATVMLPMAARWSTTWDT